MTREGIILPSEEYKSALIEIVSQATIKGASAPLVASLLNDLRGAQVRTKRK